MSGINAFIHGAPQFKVIAPCVVAKLSNDQERYVYRGATMPASTLPSQLSSLLQAGLIREVAA